MNLYSIALFVHIVGALLLFVLLTIEGVSLRAGIPAGQLNRVLGPISGLAILVPGLYLVAAGTGWKGWVAVGFTSWVLIAVATAVTGVSLMPGRVSRGAAAIPWRIMEVIAFGGLLLLGGKVADYAGRKRAFLIGLAGFAVASAIGGAAPNFATLVAARALQGAFATLLAPTALSLLAVSFTQPRERATAFAVYGSIAGSGAAIGLLLGGALTQYLAWRWCLYVNIPIAVMAGIGGWLVLPAGSGRAKAALDLPGVVLAAGGMVALVYSSTAGIGLLAVGGLLLAMFVFREARTANPLLPLRILTDRNRGGSYITVAMAIAGMFGAFLFLTYYLQVVLQFTPLQAGLAFLPMTIASQAGSWLIASRLMPYVPPRALMAPGA